MNYTGEETEVELSLRKKANSRLLFMWGWAQETDKYVKKPWVKLHGDLSCGGDIEAILWEAELLYESCQSEEWPSQF